MKLNIRLGALVSILIFISTSSVGLFSINSSFNNQLKLKDKIVEDVIDKVSKSSEDPLSISTYLADDSSLNISVAYVTPEKTFISLHTSEYQLEELPNKNILISASSNSQTFQQIRYRSFQITENEYLLFYYPIFDVYEARDNNIKILIIFTLLIIFLSVLLTLLIFRNDSELNSLATTLSENQEKMRNFIGDASHELKTPLTIIRGYFELLVGKVSEVKDLDTYILRIKSEINRMQKIINDLLFIAELDELPIEKDKSSPISELINKEIFDLSVLQDRRQITSNIESNLTVSIPQFHLEQLLSNIFSNLARHTPADSNLEVNLKRKSRFIELTIEDAGPGLPLDFYSSGIQSFKRFDSSRSKEGGGSGLGMTIISRIVKVNNGSIKISESKFHGLKFLIKLPAA